MSDASHPARFGFVVRLGMIIVTDRKYWSSRVTKDSVELLQAMWLETLRMHGAAPFQSLTNLEPIKLAGRTVPPRTRIWLHYRYIMNNSPEMKEKLGDDLDKFRPARWMGPEGIIKHSPFDSLAYGHGARVCLGRHLADYEGKLVLASVLKNFELEKWSKPPMEEVTGASLCLQVLAAI